MQVILGYFYVKINAGYWRDEGVLPHNFNGPFMMMCWAKSASPTLTLTLKPKPYTDLFACQNGP